jgi:hypothetical protein
VEPQDDDGNFEILKQSPVLGDNKFKLEIGQFSLIGGLEFAHKSISSPG